MMFDYWNQNALITALKSHPLTGLLPHVAVYDINGVSFFGAAEKAAGGLDKARERALSLPA